MEKSEAIKEFQQNIDMPFGSNISREASELAIQALEEVQQYQKIGTPEELKDMKNNYFEALSDWRQYRKIGTLKECRTAIEKQIPKKAEHKVIKYEKHKWRKGENGEIDDFAFDYGYHNGVVCEIYGKAVCVHCEPDWEKLDDCEDDYYICPTCGDKFYSKRDYCSCGQQLDWSDEDENKI